MSITLECAIPPPHLFQSRTLSWQSPYHSHTYPAPASSPAPVSPQSLQSSMSRLPESPLPSQDALHVPASAWYGPSISAPECSSEVCTSFLLPEWLLTCIHVDQLRLIQQLHDAPCVFYQPLTAHISVFLHGKTPSIYNTVGPICYNVSTHSLFSRLCSTRACQPVRRASIRRAVFVAPVKLASWATFSPVGPKSQ
jgi:hypothetical protein